jgi:hypothetical protein
MQDEDERDPYHGMRTKGAQPGKTSRLRRTRRNTKADRRGRVGAARDAVATEVPKYMLWVLANAKQTRPHFTEFQWAILQARYPSIDFTRIRNTSVAVGEALRMTGKSQVVRDAERVADRTARELYYQWAPALNAWHRWKQHKGRARPRTSSRSSRSSVDASDSRRRAATPSNRTRST